MKVELISYTRGVGELEKLSPGELLAYIARVSNPSNQNNHSTASKLLNYCWKHKHSSVFEAVFLTLKITTCVAISRQILRHDNFFQEHSQRYAEVDGFEIFEARRQDTKNRQNSIDDFSDDLKEWFRDTQEVNNERCLALYKMAIEKGVALESARAFLPMSSRTTMYMTVNVRNLIHYIIAREHNSSQKEHRGIAIQSKAILLALIPELQECFKEEEGK